MTDSQPEPTPLSPEDERLARQFAEQMDTTLDGIMVDSYVVWNPMESQHFLSVVAYDARMGTPVTRVHLTEPLSDIDAETVRTIRDVAADKARQAIKALLG